MKSFAGQKKLLNIVLIVLVAVLLISVAPIVCASFYSQPLTDDFLYSNRVKTVLNNGGGFIQVLSACIKQAKDYWSGWQGSYSSVVLFGLQPAVFSEKLYFLTAIIMLTALIASTLFFVCSVFKAVELDMRCGLIIGIMVLLLSINFVFDKHEAFFWWNGASYYTLFYAFSLILFSLLIRVYCTKNLLTRIVCFVLALILAIIIAGGNYSTALLTAVLLLIITGVVIKNKKKLIPYFLAVFMIFMAGFAFSVMSPGNKARGNMLVGESPLKAIFEAIRHAVIYIADWTGMTQLSAFIIIAFIAFAVTRNSNIKFKYPLLVLAVSILVFATQITPPLYAMSNPGGGRQINIYYYSYYLFASFNIFYFAGWVNQHAIIGISTEKIKPSVSLCGLVLVMCMAIAGCLSFRIRNITFVDTLSALINGTPQAYSREYMNRIADAKNGNTEIDEIETVPDFFAPLEISEDPNYWVNRQMASYYGVEEITLKAGDESNTG